MKIRDFEQYIDLIFNKEELSDYDLNSKIIDLDFPFSTNTLSDKRYLLANNQIIYRLFEEDFQKIIKRKNRLEKIERILKDI